MKNPGIETEIIIPGNYYDYLSMLNGIAVTTRYPDSLMQMEKSFDEPGTYENLAPFGAIGMLEYWNIGFWKEKRIYAPPVFNSIFFNPTFHRSSIPLFPPQGAGKRRRYGEIVEVPIHNSERKGCIGMDRGTVQEALNFFLERLFLTTVAVDKVILFGSYAYGEPSEESDIDIVVVSKDFEGKNIFQRVELVKEVEIATIKRYRAPLDIVTLTPEESENEASLISAYAKNGKVLYTAYNAGSPLMAS